MNIQTKAVNQAIATLKAVGAVFAVRYEGVEYGNAKLEEEKVKPVRTIKYHWDNMYNTWLKNVKPGDTLTHTLDNAEEARSLQGSISGQLSHNYGPGTYLTSLEKTEAGYKVSALYVGKGETAGV